MYLRNKILTTLSVIAIGIAAAVPAGAAQLPDTMAKPGGFPERPLWPRATGANTGNEASCSHVRVSHKRTVLSQSADAAMVPSGLNVTW